MSDQLDRYRIPTPDDDDYGLLNFINDPEGHLTDWGQANDRIKKLEAELAMLRRQLVPHTYVFCKTEDCRNGVRASRSKTGLCIECLDDRVAAMGIKEDA